MDQATEAHWRELSEEILTDVKEWRRDHPKATLREIEDEVHRRMSRLEAQIVQDAAQASPSREWSGSPPSERPRCPVCQTPLNARGKRKRKLQGVGSHTVALSREYGTCPTCGTGIFPP
jgi:uncharacterized protein with PIN domain